MEAELRAHVNLSVVLVNSEGLYVIIAVLGVSNLGRACVLTYSFTNYSRLKRNAEEVRNYIAAAAGQKSEGFIRQPCEAGGSRKGDALPSTVSSSNLVNAGNEVSMDLERRHAVDGNRSDASSVGRSANEPFPVLARQEASGAAMVTLQIRGGDGDASATVTTARTVGAAVVYSIMAGNVSQGTKPSYFTEAN
ncbi:hypothetical protein HPB49_000029 [Dermacentor silvarum]|uniref:Uncharacterized protein n=1 Tax=Dermacentor silvarum TaxID=543639 RepID=A0ACB8C6F5_DERSI|nr:hypothetical protein HPB49_000029 [Dermacentor silvarum]